MGDFEIIDKTRLIKMELIKKESSLNSFGRDLFSVLQFFLSISPLIFLKMLKLYTSKRHTSLLKYKGMALITLNYLAFLGKNIDDNSYLYSLIGHFQIDPNQLYVFLMS